MAKTLAPTKGNLMMAKTHCVFQSKAMKCLIKNENILIREMMLLIEEAKEVEAKIERNLCRCI